MQLEAPLATRSCVFPLCSQGEGLQRQRQQRFRQLLQWLIVRQQRLVQLLLGWQWQQQWQQRWQLFLLLYLLLVLILRQLRLREQQRFRSGTPKEEEKEEMSAGMSGCDRRRSCPQVMLGIHTSSSSMIRGAVWCEHGTSLGGPNPCGSILLRKKLRLEELFGCCISCFPGFSCQYDNFSRVLLLFFLSVWKENKLNIRFKFVILY